MWILDTKTQKSPSSDDLSANDKAAMSWGRSLNPLNPHPGEMNLEHFNSGLEISNCRLYRISVGSTQHNRHDRWTTSGLVFFGHFGSLCQLNCKYKEWTGVKLSFQNTVVASQFFLSCKDVVPMASLSSNLSQWFRLLEPALLGWTVKYCVPGACICEAQCKQPK